jgi:hypothetical protein
MSMKGGGYQSLTQEAATINAILDTGSTSTGVSSVTTPYVYVGDVSGKQQLVSVIIPNTVNNQGTASINWSILDGNSKTVGSSHVGQTSGSLPIPYSDAVTNSINNYINQTQKSWCYVGIALSTGGMGGLTSMGTVAGGVVSDAPIWVLSIGAGITTVAIYYAIVLAANC